MSGRLTKSVSPKAAAAILLVVVGGVQFFWFKGLLQKEPPITTQMQQSGGAGPMPFNINGDPEVHAATLAGDPEPGLVDGPGHAARFDSPVGLAVRPDGTVVVADSRNHRIRTVSVSGVVSTLAGGAEGDADGAGTAATFRFPTGVAVGPDGAVYVADAGNHRIRRVAPDGTTTTISGGAAGFADGAGAVARFDNPVALCWDAKAGRLLVADAGNRRIRFVRPDGVVSGGWKTDGVPISVASGPAGVMVAQSTGLAGAGGAGKPVPVAGQVVLRRPVAVAPAPDGFYVVDASHDGVWRVGQGAPTLLAGYAEADRHLTGFVDENGLRARFNHAAGLAADGKGFVLVGDTMNHAIRRLALPGIALPGEEGLP